MEIYEYKYTVNGNELSRLTMRYKSDQVNSKRRADTPEKKLLIKIINNLEPDSVFLLFLYIQNRYNNPLQVYGVRILSTYRHT